MHNSSWTVRVSLASQKLLRSEQTLATLLGPTWCERLHTMLCVVATCWKLLDEVWNWSNFRANKCQHFYCFAVIEAWSNNVAFVCTAHPTMLRRRTRTTNKELSGMYGIVGICVPESFVLSSKSPNMLWLVVSVCTHRATRDNNVGPTMLRVVASVCTGL